MPTTGHTPDDTLQVAKNYQDRISLNSTAPIEQWQKQADLRQPLNTKNGRHLGALSYFEAQKAIRLSASARLLVSERQSTRLSITIPHPTKP